MQSEVIMPQGQGPRLLLVEDDEFDRILIEKEFVRHNNRASVDTQISINQALANFHTAAYDAVITDMSLPDGTGLDLIGHIRDIARDIPIFVITGRGSEETAVKAIKLGANDYLVKGMDSFSKLPKLVENAISTVKLNSVRTKTIAEIETLNDRFRDFAEAASDWLWETDSENTFQFISRSIDKNQELSPDYIVGKNFVTLLSSGLEMQSRMLEQKIKLRAVFREHILVINAPSGAAHSIRISGKPYYTGSGKFLGYRGIGKNSMHAIEGAISVSNRRKMANDILHVPDNMSVEISDMIREELETILLHAKQLAGNQTAESWVHLKSICRSSDTIQSLLEGRSAGKGDGNSS